jgi:hypothetical protein
MPFLWMTEILASAGQGTPYTGPRLLFPFALFTTAYPKIVSTHSLIIAACQFPVYGLILGTAYQSRRFGFFVIGLVVLHLLAAAVLSPFAQAS